MPRREYRTTFRWFGHYGYSRDIPDTEGMTFPVRCRHCSRVYDLGKVEVVARYTDCSMWHCPGCKILADDRKPPWGIQHYDELPRRDQAFLVADEDVTFADPDGGSGLDSWDW
jgi:hypothetical protein